MQFQIQPDSEISASTQLFNQLSFAIASRQFPPGYRLPSTRQLAMQTGLHRNTISKVYERLVAAGLVEAQMGSGIYVRAVGQEAQADKHSSQGELSTGQLINQSLDHLLQQGYSLAQIRDLFLAEITHRQQASTQVLVTVPRHDLGAGEIIVQELQRSLSIPIQLVFLEELEVALEANSAVTVVTVRYFTSQAEEVLNTWRTDHPKTAEARLIPIDIYNYQRELDLIKTLPVGSGLGLVSLSLGTLGVAEVMIYSLRGEDIYVMSAQCQDTNRLETMVRTARMIICDRTSYDIVKTVVARLDSELIRLPKLVYCESYIDPHSIELLERELGID